MVSVALQGAESALIIDIPFCRWLFHAAWKMLKIYAWHFIGRGGRASEGEMMLTRNISNAVDHVAPVAINSGSP